MKTLEILFKSIAGLIILIPGVSFFMKYLYPVNSSKELLLIVCEVVGVLTIMCCFLFKDNIQGLKKKSLFFFESSLILLSIIVLISFSMLNVELATSTVNDEKVLLPISCKDKLCEMISIAHQNQEEVGMRYGKDEVIRTIEACCKTEMMVTKILYGLLMVLLFNLLIFIFVSLGIRHEITTNIENIK